ncbi:MAG: DUF1361 domain-containing protein [Dinghuibacter sp.]|nr:DUF1361 domain-containing protein [Dinghuibacter sp.]
MNPEKERALIAASCVAIILLSVRVIHTGSFNYVFLYWNLFLAWVPYVFSTWLARVPARYKWTQRFLFMGWLLFLPNAPYLVTDFIHLQARWPVPLMFDLCMLFLFALTGLVLGLLSVQQAEQWRLNQRPGKSLSGMRLGVFLLCGFGIYLGRVERFNSWEVFTDPAALAAEILPRLLNPFAHAETWGITLLFAGLLWVTYAFFKTVPVPFNPQNNK